ncbi:phospholipase effector Tle1 domain-containing protein [Roseateles sp. BYS180W]|uniref:Phospholipase effector Tle1 domain-containing protein n=1 Tax=Roseateles rivi TaxID=3299028 RepID=A0ABW7FZU7_9BURK
MSSSGLDNHHTTSTPGDDTQHEVTVDKVMANVFFDGTLNNYFNVNASDAIKAKHGGEGTSYANGLSNVARMWESLGREGDGPDIAVYVDGIGTVRHGDDALTGMAFGDGDTGIEVRVDSAFAPLVEKVTAPRDGGKPPAILELNVFGFSRGAAAARLFVHKVYAEKVACFGADWAKVIVQVNFVGLFDTVSSEGIYYGNDVGNLHLRIPATHAQRVVHLVAGDEFRENFSVTTIDSTVAAGRGYQLTLPGAHSDVGGGYTCDAGKPEPEVRELSPSLEPLDGAPHWGSREFVYLKGWYSAADAKPTFWHRNRHERVVHGDYYRVALSLMATEAKKHTGASYPAKLTGPCCEAPLEQVRQALLAFAQSAQNTVWTLEANLGEQDARRFRRRYLHLSSQEGTLPNSPRFHDSHTLVREWVRA